MNIPSELLVEIILYLRIDEAMGIIFTIGKGYDKFYILNLKTKWNIVNRFMKKAYIQWYKKKCNKKLGNFLIKDVEWFNEIISSSVTFCQYIKEVLGMFSDEFPQYNYLIEDFDCHRRYKTSLNVKKTRVVMGTSITQWYDDLGIIVINNNINSRIFTPQNIHRIYPVKLVYARKIEKSPLLRGLLF